MIFGGGPRRPARLQGRLANTTAARLHPRSHSPRKSKSQSLASSRPKRARNSGLKCRRKAVKSTTAAGVQSLCTTDPPKPQESQGNVTEKDPVPHLGMGPAFQGSRCGPALSSTTHLTGPAAAMSVSGWATTSRIIASVCRDCLRNKTYR